MITYWSIPMLRCFESANGIKGDCHHSRIITAAKVAGVGHHPIGSAVDNDSTLLYEAERHYGQTELKH